MGGCSDNSPHTYTYNKFDRFLIFIVDYFC